jgi:dihydroorotate dehydrogenase
LVYRSLLRPILFRLPPETAHHLALTSLKLTKPFQSLILPGFSNDESTTVNCFGLTFPNPLGLAAGFDKDGVALNELAALGFGHIEAGTVTYHAQPGNPRPRLFRLPKDQALINRAGFNNGGAGAFAQRVKANRPDCVLGVSIGKSKITPIENAIDDYLGSFDLVYNIADYVAVNVSSPNTPQLRELQQADQLTALLGAMQTRNQELQLQHNRTTALPLLVKLSPDLNQTDLEMIVDAVERAGIAGIIATNTTVSRNQLRSSQAEVSACGEGGLSGKPLRLRSTEMIAELYKLTKGKIPIIGVGGVFTADDAWEKISAGASLVQLYTGFIYQGPAVVKEIVEGLQRILKERGFDNIQQAVGNEVSIV